MHLLVILPRWVGDVVMCTPMLRALRRHFGRDATITAVTRPGHDALLAGTQLDGRSWVDDYVFYNRRSHDPSLRLGPVARRLRQHPADAAIIVPNSLSSAALAWLAGARLRVGFSRNGRRILLTHPLRLPWKGWKVEPSSTASAAMRLAERLGVAPEPLRLELATTSTDRAMAEAMLSEMFGMSAGPLVILNDNAATGTSRAWGHEPFAALARRINESHPDARILVHCGPDDRQEARRIVEAAGKACVRGMHDIERLPFGLSKAIIEKARLVVSSDSGPRHIAAAFGIPTVVLFGAADPRLGRSDHPGLVELRVELPCVPCNKKECPLGHRDCMRLLRVEDVYAAAAPALA